MASHGGIKSSLYQGACMILTTRHAKSIALAPVFSAKLGAGLIEYVANTDQLGTFSGEIERQGDALACARQKCAWAFERLGDKLPYALASEGSFGPHPSIPFLPCDHEILYFMDRQRDFHIHVSHWSDKTNYSTQAVGSFEELLVFAKKVLFPTHAIIMRPDQRARTHPVFKGLWTWPALEEAYAICVQESKEGLVWVETDMRASFNPSRMHVISELAHTLADRLCSQCPACHSPGWGMIGSRTGLLCAHCSAETELIKEEIFACVKCDYQDNRERSDGQKKADPAYCPYCNP